MSLHYRLMYAVGFAPWDNGLVGEELTALAGELPPGRALDLGFGTGTQSVFLAQRGWTVTGVDITPRALARARRRATAAGVDVEWLRADVGALEAAGLQPGYTLLHDRGCWHDIPDRTRAGYARGVTALAAPGAVLLLLSFAPRDARTGPRGASAEEIAAAFAGGWRLVSTEPDSGPAPPGPMRDVPRLWHRLERLA